MGLPANSTERVQPDRPSPRGKENQPPKRRQKRVGQVLLPPRSHSGQCHSPRSGLCLGCCYQWWQGQHKWGRKTRGGCPARLPSPANPGKPAAGSAGWVSGQGRQLPAVIRGQGTYIHGVSGEEAMGGTGGRKRDQQWGSEMQERRPRSRGAGGKTQGWGAGAQQGRPQQWGEGVQAPGRARCPEHRGTQWGAAEQGRRWPWISEGRTTRPF